jgi:hypothetical protein
MVESMGLILVGVLAAVAGLVIVYFLFKVFSRMPIVQKMAKFVADRLLFNFFVRTYIAGFLAFSLSSFTNMLNLNFTS